MLVSWRQQLLTELPAWHFYFPSTSNWARNLSQPFPPWREWSGSTLFPPSDSGWSSSLTDWRHWPEGRRYLSISTCSGLAIREVRARHFVFILSVCYLSRLTGLTRTLRAPWRSWWTTEMSVQESAQECQGGPDQTCCHVCQPNTGEGEGEAGGEAAPGWPGPELGDSQYSARRGRDFSTTRMPIQSIKR